MMTQYPPAPLEPRFIALGTVRQGDNTWPAHIAFPWSDAECAAFVRGHEVKWPLGIDLFWLLPGHVEMTDGHRVLHA